MRCAAVHIPLLLKFSKYVYTALSCHNAIKPIDNALATGDYKKLLEATDNERLQDFFAEKPKERSFVQSLPDSTNLPKFRQPNIETPLLVEHIAVIAKYEKECDDFADIPCIGCERLYQRKNVSSIDLCGDTLTTDVWCRSKNFVLTRNPTAVNEQHYLCSYCKPSIRDNVLPIRCVLNGLETVPVPPELAELDALSTQLIQRAKCYQIVVRLGTYTKKIPAYNSLKACKGTMFFLPLPMNKTLETLKDVETSNSLADPELYIILNGKPTKNRVIWQSLVDVNKIRRAVE